MLSLPDNERRGREMANRDLRDWIEGVRADGDLAGYPWGIERKRELIKRERV